MTRGEKIRKILSHYGTDQQMGIAQEECAELIQAISKVRRLGGTPETMAHLAEELADALIVSCQMAVAFDLGDAVFTEIDRKLDRQMRRIKKEDQT